MLKYNKEYLKNVLKTHDYNSTIMTPEWCSFALQLLIVEKLDKLINND